MSETVTQTVPTVGVAYTPAELREAGVVGSFRPSIRERQYGGRRSRASGRRLSEAMRSRMGSHRTVTPYSSYYYGQSPLQLSIGSPYTPLTQADPYVAMQLENPFAANSRRGRSYSDMLRFNTDNTQIFTAGGKLIQSAANTSVTRELQLPLVVNRDGTAIGCELIKIELHYPTWDNHATGTYTRTFRLYIDGPGSDDSYLSSDYNFCYDTEYRRVINGGVSDLVEKDQQIKLIDLTDRAGHGRICVAPLTAYFSNSGWSGTQTLRFKLWYRQHMLTTAAYVDAAQRQRHV